MTLASTYTLWKYNDRENKLTYSLTIRPGWTPDMLQESRNHYVAACQAARDGKRTLEGYALRNEYSPCPHDEPRVQIFGDIAVQVAPGIMRQVTINCFTETQTGQQLLDELWALVDVLQAIEAVAVLEQASTPQPATLRPSNKVPTTIEAQLARRQIELMAYAADYYPDDITGLEGEPSYGDGDI